MKALEDWQISDMRKRYAEGETALKLAQEYHVHFRAYKYNSNYTDRSVRLLRLKLA